eukprot:scaffold15337_cov105-Skeletonema_dohrnii-CCMP3373.AAC.2
MTDNRSPFTIPHCANAFDPSVAAFVGENNNGSDANESFEMTMLLSSSRPRMADAKLDKSVRVVDGGRDMASVLEDGGWNRVRLISSAMVQCLLASRDIRKNEHHGRFQKA